MMGIRTLLELHSELYFGHLYKYIYLVKYLTRIPSAGYKQFTTSPFGRRMNTRLDIGPQNFHSLVHFSSKTFNVQLKVNRLNDNKKDMKCLITHLLLLFTVLKTVAIVSLHSVKCISICSIQFYHLVESSIVSQFSYVWITLQLIISYDKMNTNCSLNTKLFEFINMIKYFLLSHFGFFFCEIKRINSTAYSIF